MTVIMHLNLYINLIYFCSVMLQRIQNIMYITWQKVDTSFYCIIFSWTLFTAEHDIISVLFVEVLQQTCLLW